MIAAGERIGQVRRGLGSELLILGHYYQRDEVLRHADAVGDSLELARRAAREKNARKIVFCGVRFMAETADILSGPGQTVYMPEPEAGCPMADMADAGQMTTAWNLLNDRMGQGTWLPVVYVNSSAETKALCGQWGGSACTSGNATAVFEWVLKQGRRVFFLPDLHLGTNTAVDLGIPEREVGVYDPAKANGGLDVGAAANLRVVVWKGHCCVHTAFKPEPVMEIRKNFPQAKIIVHPETPLETTRLTDAHGSTARIIQYVRDAAPGTTIFVGTEANLVARLAKENEGRVPVKWLRHSLCRNMSMTTEENLATTLQSWPETNAVRVAAGIAANARLALERMLAL